MKKGEGRARDNIWLHIYSTRIVMLQF